MSAPLDRALWADLVGRPFRVSARGPKDYDCFGLVLEIYRRRGIVIPDFYYSDDPALHADLFGRAMNHWEETPVEAGVALLFRSFRSTAPQHVGVAIDPDLYIHATEDAGQVVLTRLSRTSRNLFLSAWRPTQKLLQGNNDAV